MKKWLIIIGVVVILIIAVVIAAFALKPAATQPNQANTQTQFPNSGNTNTSSSTSQLLSVATLTGGSVLVKNFENSPTTAKDPTGDGYYYVSGGLYQNQTHAPYQIFYDSEHQYFGITLYKEPLGQYRTQAENELMQDLGISQQQMCSLNYDISVGQGINDLYVGQNLGFSFCPGAVALP